MMLPKPGIYYFPWEVSDGLVPDGSTLRTFGRLCLYDMTRSLVTLTAQHRSDQYQLLVCTKLVEPFQAHVDSLYVVLGELEREEGGDSVVKARVLTCVEGMNLSLLEQAICEQRLYQQKRNSQPIGNTSTYLTLPPAPEPLQPVGASPTDHLRRAEGQVLPPRTLDCPINNSPESRCQKI